MSRILIVEDERHLADGLRFNLEAEHHEITVVENGEAALARIEADPGALDLVLLDVMLPGIDGFTVAGQLRQRGIFIPILMMTARGRAEDVLRGFEVGADDYLPKPFELSILLARVRGLIRRREWLQREAEASSPGVPAQEAFTFAGKAIDFSRLEVRVGDKRLPLTVMEAALLRYLVQHQGRPVSRKTILEQVWGVREDTDTRAIDNFIVRLRKYLEDEPSRPKHLQTVRGIGYRFVAEPVSGAS